MVQLLARAALWLSAACVATMMLLTAVSTIARYLFNAPIPNDVPYTAFLMAPVVFLALAQAQLDDAHPSVTVVSDRLPKAAARVLFYFGQLLSALFWLVVAIGSFYDAANAFKIKEYFIGQHSIYLWPYKAGMFIGVLLMLLSVIATSIYVWRGTQKNDA